jgi:maltose alpha-D-glucosyltransferase/alpha-amylase
MPVDPKVLRPPLWYKDAVIYEVHVRAFADSNDDGIGDFVGLSSRLDYLSRLGVDTIWLLPFYPSPLRDDGYDIADYYDVHSSYGTIDDFREFLDAAHARNMRVVTELVINHTSDQHPWFQRARRAAPGSPERDFYVWSDTPDKFGDARIIFQDTEASNWSWDAVAGAYYWHRFFSHQPDLNYDNELVRDAIADALRFWFDLGVDGLRLDAVPYLYQRDGTSSENLPETHTELKRLRSIIDEHYENRMLIAEANQWPEDSVEYFGDGDECHMAFHFPLMPRLYLALQRENRLPIIDILEQTPPIPDDAQWAIFLRNHDELTLEMVSEEERDLMWRTYAPDRRARLNLGIRRRLAPLLDNDRRRIELMFSLLLSLPGTPVMYYGDEIGMGDNIFLADRDGVRTPMQWSNDRNAGFSRANPQSLYLPVVVDPQFHYETVNVEAQQANPNSLLWWVRDMVRRRKRHPVFGRGSIEFLAPENEQVLAYLREGENETVLVVANLSRQSQFVELDLSRYVGQTPTEMLGRTDFPGIGETPYLLSLGPYGYYWFSIDGNGSESPGNGDVIQLHGPLEDAFASDGPFTGILGRHLENQSWFRGRRPRRSQISVKDVIPITEGEQESTLWIALVSIAHATAPEEVYLLPVGISFERDIPGIGDEDIIARVRRDGQEGLLYDGLADERFRRSLLIGMLSGAVLLGRAGSLECAAGDVPFGPEDVSSMTSTVSTSQRGETYISFFDDGVAIKLFRAVESGMNPDLELRRFLTERTAFSDLTDAYGALEYHSGETHTIGVLQQSFSFSKTAWRAFADACASWLAGDRDETVGGVEVSGPPTLQNLRAALAAADTGMDAAVAMARQLGITTARMHLALGSPSEDPDLRPVSFTLQYQQSLYQSLRAGVRQELRQIRRREGTESTALDEALDDLVASEAEILAHLDPIRRMSMTGSRIRTHGDFRLDEVYMTNDGDGFLVEDFSGDHTRPLSERRLRGSPLRDVTNMVRSIDYVAVRTAMDGDGDTAAAAVWARSVAGGFVDAYLEEMDGSTLLPDSDEAIDALLGAFAVARSLRELHWELTTRRDWVPIPLAGIRRLLSRDPVFIEPG